MLNPSRLYSFLDTKHGFALHFLEGQKLVHDLALIHSLRGSAFAYFRDSFLGFMPMICFLKQGENLGIYLDSENPYFRMKVEADHAGRVRTLLLPEEFNQFPMKITGSARVSKQFPNGEMPYTSIIQFKDVETKELTNQLIRESYQVNAEVIVSEASDQALIAIRLPPVNVNKESFVDPVSVTEYLKKQKNFLHGIFDEHLNDVQQVVKAFEAGPFAYLASRQVSLACPCSKEQMMGHLRLLYSHDLDHLYAEKSVIETRCDYCKKVYSIVRSEIEDQKLN